MHIFANLVTYTAGTYYDGFNQPPSAWMGSMMAAATNFSLVLYSSINSVTYKNKQSIKPSISLRMTNTANHNGSIH